MEKKEVVGYIADALRDYGAVALEYRGVEFVGIKNPYSESDMAFSFSDEFFTMEFTTQAARFAYDDVESAIVHAKRFLDGEYVAVEIFADGKAIMGGTRLAPTDEISNTEAFADWYACENAEVAARVVSFLRRGGVFAKVSSWNGKSDIVVEF